MTTNIINPVVIVDCTTGEEIIREATTEELEQAAKDAASIQAYETELAAKAQARQALLDKLGITEEEAKLLLENN